MLPDSADAFGVDRFQPASRGIHMRPIKISLVSLGSLKYPVNTVLLEAWESDIISIHRGSSIGHLPDAEGAYWDYPDHQLLELLSPDADCDFTLGLINAPIEDNFYLRRLSDRVAVLSLHEMAEIVRYSDFTLEQYVLRNAYELAVLYAANGKLIPTDYATWAHDEIRGCLFDMNSSKPDIVFSLHRPILCQACKTRVSAKQVPAALLPALESELQKIKKSLFIRLTEWVKKHPLIALAIAATSGIVFNLVASIIFEKAKRWLPWLG